MQFHIKDAFHLKSAGKLMIPGTYYTTEDDAQIAELRERFEPDGSCQEVKAEKKAHVTKAVESTDNDDLSLVKGIGAALLEKLNEKGITTKSQLKAAVTDRADEMKELLATRFEK